MSVVLVIEPDSGYAARIEQALRASGLQVQTVDDVEAAERAAKEQPPSLVLASGTLPAARDTLKKFSTEAGGPGSVVMLPSAMAASADAAALGADHVLAKPFADRELQELLHAHLARQAIAARQAMSEQAASSSKAVGGKGDQLTSADIFGDVLAEVEAEAQKTVSRRRGGKSRTSEIDRKLEETLSGVLPVVEPSKRPPAIKGTSPQKPVAPSANEIDLLLDRTLSSLELPKRQRRAKRPAEPKAPSAITPAISDPVGDPPDNLDARGPSVVEAEPTTESAAFEDIELDDFDSTDFDSTDSDSIDSDSIDSDSTDSDIEAPAEVGAVAAGALAAEEAAEPSSTEPPPEAPWAFDEPTGWSVTNFDEPATTDDSSAMAVDASQSDSKVGGTDKMDAEEIAKIADEPEADFASIFSTQRLVVQPDTEPTPAEAASNTANAEATDHGGPQQALDGVMQIRGDARETDLDDEEGTAFGDYRLLERVAVGGMAEVWRARRRGVEGFQKQVAIKKILSHLTGSSDFVTMFIDEAKLAAQLSHNNIIQIYDLGKVDDDFFIAMEFVEGSDLRTILTNAKERNQSVPLPMALLIVAALARALDYAHRKRDFEDRAMGLVHRDVSPQNVLIGFEGEIKLCDFGIVKAVAKASTTQMGALKGKLQYMSPEQAWGREVDARSDIFSLGSVFFEILTGVRLFAGDSEIGVLDAVRDCRVRSVRELEPDIPLEVERIVQKALAKTPEQRYQTAGEMEQDIKQVAEGIKPVPSQADVASYMHALFKQPPPDSNAAATAAGLSTTDPTSTDGTSPETSGTDATGPATGSLAGDEIATATPSDASSKKSGNSKLLIAILVFLALVAVVAYVLVNQSSEEATGSTTPAPATTQPTSVAPTPDSTVPPATAPETGEEPVDGVDPAAPTDTDAQPADGSDQAATDADDQAATDPADGGEEGSADNAEIQQLIDEELESQREQMQRDFEARKRAIEEEIARVQREQEAAQNQDGGDDGSGNDG